MMLIVVLVCYACVAFGADCAGLAKAVGDANNVFPEGEMKGATYLQFAQARGFSDIAKLLKESGAK